MGENMSRRNGIRNRFEMDKNYLVPLICIVITCITIITCIVIVININSQLNQIKNQNSLNQYVNENTDFNIIFALCFGVFMLWTTRKDI